jgi:hypothetical protein
VLTDAGPRRAYDERRANGHAPEGVAVAVLTNGHPPVAADTRIRASKPASKPAAAPAIAAMQADVAVAALSASARRKTNGASAPRRNGSSAKATAAAPIDGAAFAATQHIAEARTVVADEPAHVAAANNTHGVAEGERHGQAPARVSAAVHDTLARIASIVPHRRPELEAAMAAAENDRLLALRVDDFELPRADSPAVIERPFAVVDQSPREAAFETSGAPTDAPAIEESPAPSRAHPRLAARIVFETGPVAGLTLLIGGSGGDNESVELALRDGEATGPLLRVVDRDGVFVLIHIDGPNAIVGGQEMTLPVLVLDDGDTIAYGGSVARFQLA